tara:strand:+ start:88 stop:1161 length:1074 start_codon:yes stop_codon:yes gene_type:complete
MPPPGTGSLADAIAFSGISGPTAGANSQTRAQINSNNNTAASTRLLNARRINAEIVAQDKAEAKAASDWATKVAALDKEKAVKKSNNVFEGVGDWFTNLFGDTSNDTEEDKFDAVGTALTLASPVLSVFKRIVDEGRTGMNDIAKDEWSLLNKEASRDPNSPWHTMSDAQKAHLARKPQIDNQLPHAFIDGNPTTDVQKKIALLTNGKAPTSTVYNGDGSVNIERTALTANNGGDGGQNLAGQAPASPNWWEEGYVAPIGGAVQPPWFSGGGVSGGQQIQGLPGYLQNELAATPDFTGSYQSSLLGNTALPSQQITGLLAPPQQQPQQYNFTTPQQQPQVTLEQLKGLLGGYNGFIG